MSSVAAAVIRPYRLPLALPVADRAATKTSYEALHGAGHKTSPEGAAGHKTSPEGAAGHVIDHRDGFIVALCDPEGRVGLGDCCPWGEATSLRPALESAARGLLRGEPPVDLLARAPAAVRWCLELALADLAAQQAGVPLWRWLLPATLTPREAPSVAVSALVHDLRSAQAAAAAGYQTLKVKLRGAADLHIVRTIRAELPAVALRVDYNRSLEPEAQAAGLAALARLHVELVEEPGAAPQHPTAPPCYADESVRDLDSLQRLGPGYAGVVVKPGFSGLHEALALARAAHASGRDVVVTHVLDSAVGRAGAAQVALALAAQGIGQRAHGLSHTTLVGDVARPLAIHKGRLSSDAVGLGVRLPDAEPPADAAGEPGPTDLPHPVAAAARARPDHVALVQGAHTLTWSELRARVAAEAGGLWRAGVRSGDLVALEAPLSIDSVVRLHAITWLGAVAAPGVATGADALVAGRADGAPAPERDSAANQDRYAVATSGTTGDARVVRLGALQVTLSAFGSAMRLGHALDDRWHLCLPLDRVGGIMILERCALAATTTVLPPEGRFDAAWLAQALIQGDVSVVSLVPTQLERLVEALGGRAISPRVRALLVGGAPIPADLCARAANLPLARTWGMTETASQVATELCDHQVQNAHNAPPVAPLPFARLSLLSGPRGDQLVVEGPLARGRLVTRDVGTLDEHGRVRVTGRADDTIISGGINLDPVAIERAFAGCPGVHEALAVGLPDLAWGERPHLAYTGDAAPTAVLAWGRAHLPRLQQPESAVCVEQLPIDALGKRSRARARSAFPGGSRND